MQDTVWSTGCSSWYLDDTGRNATLWPDWTFAFRRRAARFDAAEYELGAGAPGARARRRGLAAPARTFGSSQASATSTTRLAERDQQRRGDHRALDHREVGVVHARRGTSGTRPGC